LQNYELEPESVVKKSTPDIKAATKKPVTKKPKLKPAIDKELESKLRSKLEEQLTSELEIKLTTKLKVEIEAELKPKLEADLKEQIEVDLRIKLEQEFEEKLKQKIKVEELLDPETKSEPVTAFETKQKTESKSKELIDFDMDTKRIVEAILFAADKPMTSKQVRNVYPELERPEIQEIQFAINSIIEDYAPRPIGLKLLASGYSFQVKDGFSYYRFVDPKLEGYAKEIELFAVNNHGLILEEGQRIIPIDPEEGLYSLSAIMLDKEYFEMIKNNIDHSNQVPCTNTLATIMLKISAFYDLKSRSDDKWKKHRRDILKLVLILTGEERIELTGHMVKDVDLFMEHIESLNDKTIKQITSMHGISQADIFRILSGVFGH